MISNLCSNLGQQDIQKQVKCLKQRIQQINELSKEILSLSSSFGGHRKQDIQGKIQLIQLQIKQKMKNIAINIDQMVILIDYKLAILVAYITKMQKNDFFNKNYQEGRFSSSIKQKNIIGQSYQIKKLEDRIYDYQLKQKETAKEIQQMKQKNKKLMEEFSKLSLNSNNKIVQLSEQIHNNTSPNLTIRSKNKEISNPQLTYIASERNYAIFNKGRDPYQPLKSKYSPFQNQYKKTTSNILSGLISEQSSFDKNFLQQQSSRQGLKFGCIPTKNYTEKTKTGSSSINKNQTLEDRSDKKRRFQFLLNNLNKEGNNQKGKLYGSYQDSQKEGKSVFQSNVVRRYQI